MNNVTLKVDFQGVNHMDMDANPIDPKATAGILLKWGELAELLSQKMTLADGQRFDWYMHIGVGWKGMGPQPETPEGHAEVTVWQKCELGGEYAVTKMCSLTITSDKYGVKWLGWIPITEMVDTIAKRFKETE